MTRRRGRTLKGRTLHIRRGGRAVLVACSRRSVSSSPSRDRSHPSGRNRDRTARARVDEGPVCGLTRLLGVDEDAAMPTDDDGGSGAGGGVSRRGFVGAAGAAGAALVTTPALAFAGSSGPNPIYRIHPAIGVARLGNADPSTFFIGPEAPGYGPLGSAPGTQVPAYKAADGRVKPQAARYRIYEYATVSGRLIPVREVNLDTPGVTSITWSVHLANKKASFHKFAARQGEVSAPAPLRNATVTDRASLEIDFGERTASGRSKGPIEFRAGSCGAGELPDRRQRPARDRLSRAAPHGRQGAADRARRPGQARVTRRATPPPMATYANNDGWFDDASDGPVTASSRSWTMARPATWRSTHTAVRGCCARRRTSRPRSAAPSPATTCCSISRSARWRSRPRTGSMTTAGRSRGCAR